MSVSKKRWVEIETKWNLEEELKVPELTQRFVEIETKWNLESFMRRRISCYSKLR